METKKFLPPYQFDPNFKKPVAYFSMEFAVDQALKIYSGGLGYLAGSHLRSAYDLKQNLIGIGILWKYGYYDQQRDQKNFMATNFIEKSYQYLEDTGVTFPVTVHGSTVMVKAMYLHPDIFGSAPMFLLTTDIPENDYLSQTITHKLYDSDAAARVAQSIILGVGGAKLLDILHMAPDIYHMNEGHALPLAFYLHNKFENWEDVKKRLVFTTHTPEAAGNEERPYQLLKDMSFFYGVSEDELRSKGLLEGESLNYTLTALRLAGRANAVSKIHAVTANNMWQGNEGICEIIPITNAQNRRYWVDPQMQQHYEADNDDALMKRKKEMKRDLFKIIADQTGKIFDPNILTVVWARRFAGYKRANLIMKEFDRFLDLVNRDEMPVQFIWGGKPYPFDYSAIDMFNDIIRTTKGLERCAVVTGYELELSAKLKKGSDVWLNNPAYPREASGTSGMTAAMNGSVNLSIDDGWFPEFVKHGKNGFVVHHANEFLPYDQKDHQESIGLFDVLEKEIVPMYYKKPAQWIKVMKSGMKDVHPEFDSDRMAKDYYKLLYNR
jgi:glycogen phosphorylase